MDMYDNIKLSSFGDATAGAVGAVISNLMFYPLDLIKTRLQVQSYHRTCKKKSMILSKSKRNAEHYSSALNAFLTILKKEGIAGLYSGVASGIYISHF
jgi:hypothetical protein